MSTTTPVQQTAALPSLLTGQEVADLLGASTRTVRRLAQEGVLDRVRIGHRTSRYTQRSVRALIDPQTSEASAGNRGFTENTKADVSSPPDTD